MATNFEDTLTKQFLGYESRAEITNSDPAFLVEGSENMLVDWQGSLVSRNGNLIQGATGTDGNGVRGAFTWRTSRGDVYVLRRHGIKLEVRIATVSGGTTTYSWHAISSSLADCGEEVVSEMATVWDDTNKIDKLIFPSFTEAITEWSGALIEVASVTSNTITKVEGTESAYASYPTTPANSIVIGYVLVNDASASTTPDLSGYMLKADKATQASNITGTNDTTYVTPLANAIKENTVNKSSSFTASSTTTYANTKALVDGLATKAFAQKPKTAIPATPAHYYSTLFYLQAAENFSCVVDSIRGNPFLVKKSETLDSLSIRIASGATAGTNGRFAIYSDLNGSPYLKLWEGSNFSTAATSTIVVSGINLALTGGIYWAVFNSSASSGLIRTSTNGINPEILGYQMNVSSPTAYNGIAYASQSFASAFPSDLSLFVSSGFTTGTSCPAIYQGYL